MRHLFGSLFLLTKFERTTAAKQLQMSPFFKCSVVTWVAAVNVVGQMQY